MDALKKRLPWRIQQWLLRRFLEKHRVEFTALPYVEGLEPHIVNDGRLIIGDQFCFMSHRLPHNIVVKQGGTLTIGPASCFNDGVNICATRSISIGAHAKIGDMVYIYDTDFHTISADQPVRHANVVIGDNVWIGSNSMVMPGATIGDHAVIAAGSIVTGDIPPRCLAAGAPARVLKQFDAEEGWVRS